MSRIAGVPPEKAGLFIRFVYWMARRKVGKLPEPLTIIAHHPSLPLGYGMMEMAMERAKLVKKPLKSLVEIKVAALIGCPF